MARRGSKLGQSVLDLLVDDSKFTSGLDRNKKKAQSWTDTLNRDVKRGIGQGLGIGAGLGVASAVEAGISGVKAVVAGSISAAIEWESAFAGVRKTVDASPAEFEELEGSIRDMSKEMPIATTELAGLAEAAGALGIAKEDIEEFTRVTAMIGTTTDVSADQAATSLGQLSNVLGLTSDDYERFGSTLVDLGNKGASTESQILEIASRAGAGSKLVGMATDETLAWASAVANLGIEAEAGGSSLQTFFLKSTKAISEGSDKLDTYARVAGTTAAEFKRAFEQDASGALQTFLDGLGKLSQGEQLQALEDLDFNDVRITRTLLGLAGNVDNLGDSLDVASEAWEENAAMAEEAEKRYGTTESKLIILGNRVNDLAITFGEELTPALVDLATLGVEELERFAESAGSLSSDIAFNSQKLSNQFGDQGDAIRAMVDRGVGDFADLNVAIARYMTETGASFDQAVETIELYGTGNAIALKGMEDDWAAMQGVVSGSLRGLPGEAAASTEGIEGALVAGQEGIGAGIDGIVEEITPEMQKARDDAVKAMGEMLTGISNMFETDETLRDSWQALIDRMDDPYTEAERKADIFSQNTIAAIQGAITSGDPLIAQDATALVNNMLAQIQLMEPGALASGDAVPPAIRAGMDAQMGALITYLETERGIILGELTLEEAEQLGLDGIWLYAQGMRGNELEATRAAQYVAGQAAAALAINAWNGGYSVISTWIGGMTYAWDTDGWKIDGIVGHVADIVGRSLPRRGPLQHPDHGGESIGSTWIDSLAGTIGGGLPDIASAVAGVADTMTIGPGLAMPSLPGVAGLGAGAGATVSTGPGSTSSVVEYHLHYGGQERIFNSRVAFMDELEGLDRFNEEGV